MILLEREQATARSNTMNKKEFERMAQLHDERIERAERTLERAREALERKRAHGTSSDESEAS